MGAGNTSEDLQNEIEAINSIYGEGTIETMGTEDVYILQIPQQKISLRIRFPSDYPAAPPLVLGTESSGEHMRKGEAAHIVDVFRGILGSIYQPGQVCLFDVIEEVNNSLPYPADAIGQAEEHDINEVVEKTSVSETDGRSELASIEVDPPWIKSDVVVELKSVFIARSAHVSSPDQATKYLQHLLDHDRKVRLATHNITAWRIKGDNCVTFQDCNDDGETAAGGRVLHLMQLMDLWDVMVVVTRWYGGHQLGPKRFTIINTVARDAFVKGGFVTKELITKRKSKH